VIHSAHPDCALVGDAIDEIFETCGKRIIHKYESDSDDADVSIEHMKNWLNRIRTEARSMYF